MDTALTVLPPAQEEQRLQALHRYLVLDTPEDEAFDLLTEAAAEICHAPFATVSLVDRDRVWVKAGLGLPRGDMPRAQACCSVTVVTGDYLEIPDLAQDARTIGLTRIRQDLGAQMYAGASLVTSDGQRIGTLCVMDTQPRSLSERQRRILTGLAHQVMSLIELRAHQRLLKEALEKAEYLAATDVLTGLLNRRALFERLDNEAAKCRRYGTPLSLVLLDLDHFKHINDTLGHPAGDAVLNNVGKLVASTIRAVDIAGRYGGEEICVLLPQTGPEGAMQFAEHLRQKLAALNHALNRAPTDDMSGDTGGDAAAEPLIVTASLGVASAPTTGCEPAELLKAADEALYASKKAGRNRVTAVHLGP